MHKIDNLKGFDSIISYKTTPWHGLGKVFDTEITVTEALNESGLNFNVIKLPNIHRFLNKSVEVEIVSKNSFFTIRTDVNKVLGDKLGKQYNIVQNEHALAICDLLMQQNKNIKIETCGSLDEGRLTFICLKINEPIVHSGDDITYPYMLISNSFDGSSNIQVLYTDIRVVCFNTYSLAIEGSNKSYTYKIRHTSSAFEKLKEAVNILGLGDKINNRIQDVTNKFIKTELLEKDIDNMLNKLFDVTDVKEMSTQISNKKIKIIDYYNNGLGQDLDYMQNTQWKFYNAITGYYANVENYKADERFKNLTGGTSTTIINKSLNLLLKNY